MQSHVVLYVSQFDVILDTLFLDDKLVVKYWYCYIFSAYCIDNFIQALRLDISFEDYLRVLNQAEFLWTKDVLRILPLYKRTPKYTRMVWVSL